MVKQTKTYPERLAYRIERLLKTSEKLGDWKDATAFGARLSALKGDLENGRASGAKVAAECMFAKLILQTIDLEAKLKAEKVRA